MRVSSKRIKGKKVYIDPQAEPWGIISDVIFGEESGRALGYTVKTFSLVPLCKVIEKDNIRSQGKKLVIKNAGLIKSVEEFDRGKEEKTIKTESVKSIMKSDMTRLKTRDINFDFETGEMTDIVVSKNIFSGKKNYFVNKIYLKDNTIYIEDEGGKRDV